MLRAQLIQRVAELNPHLPYSQADAVVRAILDRITEALMEGDQIELRGFGALKTTAREARRSRNPRTGEAVEVPAKRDVAFRASREMNGRLNPTPSQKLRAAE
ncbi:histone family protein DNA-binding protein [Methylobacterium sp. 4-46]|uniref:HU family DNA-binding protein n=1 Tax=unclassified Methylobacterium TaxID=2615210 RepID=UPI000165C756|nr:MULTISPECIES: HU family DNA-binding protein [Methylobacterium]ACA17759.1 histone family protein DNA-binding protein [Methylobacterium sp. 4-46]WFT83428.1 integration host factor subunit beta [Methylobacterium nodulans]